MDQTQEIDVARIMEQIRETIRKRRVESSVLESAPPVHNEQMAADLAALHSECDIYHVHFRSHRKALGWLVVSAKKVLRQLLTPILERQMAYNATNSRIASSLWQHLEQMSEQQSAALQACKSDIIRLQLEQKLAFKNDIARLQREHRQTCEEHANSLQVLQAEVQRLVTELQTLRMGVSAQLHDLQQGVNSGLPERDA